MTNTKAAIAILRESLKSTAEEEATLSRQVEYHEKQSLFLKEKVKALKEKKKSLEEVIKNLEYGKK